VNVFEHGSFAWLVTYGHCSTSVYFGRMFTNEMLIIPLSQQVECQLFLFFASCSSSSRLP
jgi:hypothetical protein